MAGRKMNDMGGYPHTSDMQMKSGNKLKSFRSADGAGELNMDYPDTTEHIHRDQEKGESKVRGHKMKPGYRY